MMQQALEVFGIIIGLGIPVTYLAFGYIPAVVVKAAGVTLIALVAGYTSFLMAAFIHGVASELHRFTYGFATGLRKHFGKRNR